MRPPLRAGSRIFKRGAHRNFYNKGNHKFQVKTIQKAPPGSAPAPLINQYPLWLVHCCTVLIITTQLSTIT